MVNQVSQDFKYLLDDTKDYFTGDKWRGPKQGQVTLMDACLRATWGHDLIEDTRVNQRFWWQLQLTLLQRPW
jgi:hypothetical protein